MDDELAQFALPRRTVILLWLAFVGILELWATGVFFKLDLALQCLLGVIGVGVLLRAYFGSIALLRKDRCNGR